MPVALLAGEFSQGDLADEALIETFVAALPGWTLQATTHDPEGAERAGCVPLPAGRTLALARAARGADLLLVGGRTVAGGYSPAFPPKLGGGALSVLTAAAAAQRPLALVGVGVTSMRSFEGRLLARRVIERADLLILRDEESAVALAGSGTPGPFRVGADPLWGRVHPRTRGRLDRARSLRVITASPADRSGSLGPLLPNLAAALRLISSAGVAVELQAWRRMDASPSEDDRLVGALRGALGRSTEVVPSPASLQEGVESLAGVGCVLAFRSDALVAAAAAGVPALAVAGSSSDDTLGAPLSQQLSPFEVDPETLAVQVARGIAADAPATRAVQEQIDKAEDSLRLLRVLLSGGSSAEADLLGALPLSPPPQPPAPRVPR